MIKVNRWCSFRQSSDRDWMLWDTQNSHRVQTSYYITAATAWSFRIWWTIRWASWPVFHKTNEGFSRAITFWTTECCCTAQMYQKLHHMPIWKPSPCIPTESINTVQWWDLAVSALTGNLSGIPFIHIHFNWTWSWYPKICISFVHYYWSKYHQLPFRPLHAKSLAICTGEKDQSFIMPRVAIPTAL